MFVALWSIEGLHYQPVQKRSLGGIEVISAILVAKILYQSSSNKAVFRETQQAEVEVDKVNIICWHSVFEKLNCFKHDCLYIKEKKDCGQEWVYMVG